MMAKHLTPESTEFMRVAVLSVRKLKKAFEDQEIYVAANSSTSVVPFCHVSKAFQTHGAVVTLCRAGFGSEAFALSRLILEMSITIRWITNQDQVKRADAFALFEAKRKEYFAKAYTKYSPNNAAFTGVVQFVENLYRQYTEKYDSFKFWSNSPNNLRGMAAEPELLDGSMAPPNDIWRYDIPYSMASDYVHCNAVALGAFYPPTFVPYEVLRVDEPRLADQAIFSATQWLFYIVTRVNTYRDLGMSAQIDKAYRPFQAFVLAHP